MLALVVTFAGVSLLATLVPGPDTAVVIRNAVLRGRWAATVTAAGCSTGQIGWGAVSIGGIAAVLATSVVAFTIVKWLGVAYLGYLGIRSILSAARSSSASSAVAQNHQPLVRSAYRDGLLTNALNPKTAFFMSALLPQFIEPGAPWWLPAALVATTGTVSFLCMSVYAVVFSRVGDLLRQPRVRRAVDGIIGTVLIGFGVRLAFAQS